MTLRSKYVNMYIPSDFFNSNSPWVDNLPLNRPFGLGQSSKFHVMHKEVSPLTPETAVLDPPDADHKFCAKVSVWTVLCIFYFAQKVFSMSWTVQSFLSLLLTKRVLSFVQSEGELCSWLLDSTLYDLKCMLLHYLVALFITSIWGKTVTCLLCSVIHTHEIDKNIRGF